MPKVSVIIPTHKRAEFLRAAITSVLNQTFQDFEIVIVDDASKDHTREVIANFNDARIKVIHNQVSKGAAGARNAGIINSYSDYIAFLDDDDEWLQAKLEMQISILENSPQKVGGVHTGDFGVDKSTERILNVSLPKKRGNIYQDILVENCIVTSSLMLRITCFVKVGLFDERMPTSSDYDMWV